MPYVYLLQCADGTYYTGWTTDLDRRLAAHNRGTGARYTRARLPVVLVYAEETPDRSASLKREHQIRRLSRNEKVKLTQTGGNRAGSSKHPTAP